MDLCLDAVVRVNRCAFLFLLLDSGFILPFDCLTWLPNEGSRMQCRQYTPQGELVRHRRRSNDGEQIVVEMDVVKVATQKSE